MKVLKDFKYILSKEEQRKVIGLLVMMVFAAGFEVVGVGMMLPLMTAIVDPDCITGDGLIAKVCALLGITDYKSFVLLCVIGLIIIYVVKDTYIIIETKIQVKFLFSQRFKTQCKIYDAYMQRSYEFFLGASSGELYRVVTTDVVHTFALLTSLLTLASEGIIAIAMILTVLIISPLMTILVGLAMGITAIAVLKVIRPIMSHAGDTSIKYNALYNTWMNQSISGIKEIKVSNTENFFKETFNFYGGKLVEAQRKYDLWLLLPRMIIEMVAVCSALGVVALLLFNGYSMQNLVPAMSAFAMAAVKLLPSANRIVNVMNAISFEAPAMERLVEEIRELDARLVSVPVSSPFGETPKTAENSFIRPKEKVELSNITYAYPANPVEVLKDASMEVPIGKSVGIVGTSGAGKTTAVDVLLGLLKPSAGAVLSDGVDIQSDYEGWLQCVAYIPQTIFLTDDSIKTNVAFGIKPEYIDEARVWKALEQAQLGDFVRSLPDGIENQVGERGVRLSGGQRQRIGVARALYKNPEILVFDEATSALDNETESAIMESINALHGEKTLIIIAHRLTTIEGCDMVYRVGEGKITRER